MRERAACLDGEGTLNVESLLLVWEENSVEDQKLCKIYKSAFGEEAWLGSFAGPRERLHTALRLSKQVIGRWMT